MEDKLRRALALMWFAYVNKDDIEPHVFETRAVEEAKNLLGTWDKCMTELLA